MSLLILIPDFSIASIFLGLFVIRSIDLIFKWLAIADTIS